MTSGVVKNSSTQCPASSESINEESPLPTGWVVTNLGDICIFEMGQAPPKSECNRDGIGTAFIKAGEFSHLQPKQLEWTTKPLKLAFEGDILICVVGATIGKLNLGINCSIGRSVAAIRPIGMAIQKFIYYLLVTHTLRFRLSSSGSAQGVISKNDLSRLRCDLPPLAEQHRIVAKIEELFSEVDSGVESLKIAQAKLKAARQSLLKAAFEGKLTEQWRQDNADKLESPEALLVRIQAEREAHYQRQLTDWQQQVNDWEAAGKEGKKPRKPKAPKALPPLTQRELAELPELPSEWAWKKLGSIFSVFVGATPSRKNKDYWNGDINWVSSGEVQFCRIRTTKEKITAWGMENTSTEIHPPGTLILAMIGEGKTRGQCAILDAESTHNQNTAAIRVSETCVETNFIYLYLLYRYEETRKIGSGNNQKALNKSRVEDILFPLISPAEQSEIIKILESAFTQLDQLEHTLATSLKQAEVLKQSILKRAFAGRLVPQDPDDEPASELLARIRAERESQVSANPKRRARNIEKTVS